MWVRGLKQKVVERSLKSSMSHPMWVRGLKQLKKGGFAKRDKVAPYVGAWIETSSWVEATSLEVGRTLCGCVD